MQQSQLSGSQERLDIDEIWHLRAPSKEHVGINAEEAWRILNEVSKDPGGNKVRVVLYDLGIEHQHPGLRGTIDLEASRDFDHTLNPGGLRPPAGRIEDKFDAHGTACAGLVCGVREDPLRTEITEDKQFIGVAPMCQVLSVRISTNFELSSLIAALRYAKEAGDVILIPRALPKDPELNKVLEEVAAQVPVVCASGNDGTASLAYPASVENVIAVGACNDKGYRSTYSQYGEGLTLVAPSDDEQCEHEELVRLAKEEAEQRVEEAKQDAEVLEQQANLAEQARQRAEQIFKEAMEASQHAEQARLRVLALLQAEQPSDDERYNRHEDLVRLSKQEAEQRVKEAKQRAKLASQRAELASQRAKLASQRAEQAKLRSKLASLRAQEGPENEEKTEEKQKLLFIREASALLPEEAAKLESQQSLDRWNVERFGLRTIATTDNRGVSGYNPEPPLDYCKMDGNFGFGGTSAAAAQVAGVVALMLTANQTLKEHPKAGEVVKRILCENAAKADKMFLKPEARRGRGLLTEIETHQRFEQEFGAGLVDAAAAVKAARSWPKPASS